MLLISIVGDATIGGDAISKREGLDANNKRWRLWLDASPSIVGHGWLNAYQCIGSPSEGGGSAPIFTIFFPYPSILVGE
jgi:hypothetical protein